MAEMLEDIKFFLWENKEKIYCFFKKYFSTKNEKKKMKIQETENFKINEIAVSSSYPGLAKLPTEERIIENINKTLKYLQNFRDIYVKMAMIITSFYRDEELNKAVGGAKASDHMEGIAVDFTARIDLKKLYEQIVKDKPKFIQKIYYYPKHNFIHITFNIFNKEGFIYGVK